MPSVFGGAEGILLNVIGLANNPAVLDFMLPTSSRQDAVDCAAGAADSPTATHRAWRFLTQFNRKEGRNAAEKTLVPCPGTPITTVPGQGNKFVLIELRSETKNNAFRRNCEEALEDEDSCLEEQRHWNKAVKRTFANSHYRKFRKNIGCYHEQEVFPERSSRSLSDTAISRPAAARAWPRT